MGNSWHAKGKQYFSGLKKDSTFKTDAAVKYGNSSFDKNPQLQLGFR